MTKQINIFSFMKDFKCIGPDCEDTCCLGWEINLSEKDFKKISSQVETAETMKKHKNWISKLPRKERTSENYGVINLTDKQGCTFLDKGWCILHRDFGEKMLPTVCASFPRAFYRSSSGLEINGRLACPEVARLCLLSTQKPKLIHDGQLHLPGFYGEIEWESQYGGYYKEYLPLILSTIHEIWGLSEFSSAEKNFFCLYLAKKIGPFFYHGVVDSPRTRLEVSLTQMKKSALLRGIAKNLSHFSDHTPHVRNLIFVVIKAHLVGQHFSRFNQLTAKILKNYNFDDKETSGNQIETARVWEEYLHRKKKLLVVGSERIEQYFVNFSMNYWSQVLYMGSSTILHSARKMLLFWMLSRFLFFSHPDLNPVFQKAFPGDQTVALMDAAIVETIQIIIKTFDTNPKMVNSLLDAFDSLKIKTLDEMGSILIV